MKTAIRNLPDPKSYYFSTSDWQKLPDILPEVKERRESLHRFLPPTDWHELAQRVRQYRPDVVILVARKMPRIAELLSLDFGSRPVIVSDYAIPFIHEFIRKSRVVVIDDLINVGTTISNVKSMAEACGALDVYTYVLGEKAPEETLSQAPAPHTSIRSELSKEELASFTRSVPDALVSNCIN